jgi:hypothetical protein
MKNYKQLAAVAVLHALWIGSSAYGCRGHSVTPPPQGAAPAVALVSPGAGSISNGASLDVRVLAAAVQVGTGSFGFNGGMVPGLNGGVIARIDVSIDGGPPRSFDASGLGTQVLAHFAVDVSALAAGAHTVTATGVGSGALSQSATGTFTIDRSQPSGENRVERAAEPEPFATFDAGAGDAARVEISARIVPGALAANFDPSKDPALFSLGGQLLSIQPAQWNCDAQGCTFQAASGALHDISLRPQTGGWLLHLGAISIPADPRLFLRIGNSAGGVNLATGELLVSARAELDSTARQTKIIGADGGSIDAVDSHQIAIHLDVPAGALAADTSISLTPLLASAVVAATLAQNAGVELQPEGLHFAQPATLTFDFHASASRIDAGEQLALVTSPLSAVPLLGKADVAGQKLTTQIYHFSKHQTGAANGNTTDPAWANAASGPLSEAEIASLLALALEEQRSGCTSNCIDLGALLQRAEDSIATLAAPLCAGPASDRSLLTLVRYEALLQGLGGHPPSLFSCITAQLRGVISDAALAAQINTSDASFAKLIGYHATAQTLNLPDLETLALQGLDSGLRALLVKAQDLGCQQNFDAAAALLERAQTWQANVAEVDSTLAADLSSALADAQAHRASCVAMTAIINPSTTDPADDGASDLHFFRRVAIATCDWRFVNPAGSTDFQDCSGNFRPDFGGAASAPPMTLSGSYTGTQSSWTVTAPSTNLIAIDAIAQANPDPPGNAYIGSGGIMGQIILDLTFTKPGVFKADTNTSWVTTSGPSTTGFAGGATLQGLSTIFQVYYQYYPLTQNQQPQQTVHIDSARVVRLSVQYSMTQSSSATVAGSGRLMTLTFVPD